MSRYVSSIFNFEFIPYAISVIIFVSYKKEELSLSMKKSLALLSAKNENKAVLVVKHSLNVAD